ncbi:hypothetical protein KC678_00305 [Candidatus Dojkabacteria bacterium]|uniref:Uncharacterized protein n=1 Tax=Candidatus Dojkabacteria bacterium TaxID=2099670 RepID=A0A955IAB6_9BACT|nr:hypothetical protein [Candidatus Dojkabacteria bacterium]
MRKYSVVIFTVISIFIFLILIGIYFNSKNSDIPESNEEFAFADLKSKWLISKDTIGLDSDEGSVLGATYSFENDEKNLKITFDSSLYKLTDKEFNDVLLIVDKYIEENNVPGERFMITKYDDIQIAFINLQNKNYYLLRL